MSDKPVKHQAQNFVELVLKGMEAWTKAGEIAARAAEDDPEFVDNVCDAHPDFTPEFVKRFVLIGQKKLHPQLLINESPGVRRLRRLPYEVQEKHAHDPVALLIKTEKGFDTIQVDVRNLTPDQAGQIFSDDGVRSEAGQRAFLEDKFAKRMAPPVKSNLPYRVSGKKLIVLVPCQFDKRELTKLLLELE